MVCSRGMFIVFEGLDRSGKSTQCQKLLEYLQQSINARIQRYPDRSEPETGPEIDNFLRTAESPYERIDWIHNLFAKNRKVLDEKLRRDLMSGQTVIADRYSFSGIAYSTAKGMPKKAACATEIDLIKPDVVIYLKADSSITSQRGGFGDEVMEKSDFQEKVAKNMDGLFNATFWKTVCASGSIDDVHERIINTLNEIVSNNERDSLDVFDYSDFNL